MDHYLAANHRHYLAQRHRAGPYHLCPAPGDRHAQRGTQRGPASVRIRQDGGPIIAPGAVRFVPAGPHDSFSFTFLANAAPFEANDNHSFDVEWRSPTGQQTTLERATFNLQYEHGTQAC